MIGRASGGLTVIALTCCGALHAQQPAASLQQTPTAPEAQAVQKQTPDGKTTCLQPPPMVSWQDYEGPFAKVVGVFARKLERKEVHPPNYKPGAKLCTLEVKDKFFLFLQDTVDPVTFIGAAFNAGIGQAQNTDPSYGQGAAGYGKRVGFNLIDSAQGDFFLDFAYPTIFSEDPRYYRLGRGSTGRRFLHAVEHIVVAYRVDGTEIPNYSKWLGTISSASLSNVYHPDNRSGVGPMAERISISFGQSAGYDLLREFWPEIAHKFKLPFRGENEADDENTTVTAP